MFVISTRVSHNGNTIGLKALVDTGANGYLFISISLAIKLAQFFGITVVPLERTCPLVGYDGHEGAPITHAIILDTVIDGRKFTSQPMLIAELGQHDLIIGRAWLAENRVLPDCARGRLLWPDELPPWREYADSLQRVLPKSILRRKDHVNSYHQQDASRRDQLMEQGDLTARDEKNQDLAKYPLVFKGRRHKRHNQYRLGQMNRELKEPTFSTKEQDQLECQQWEESTQADHSQIRKGKAVMSKLDIAMIGGTGFARHLRSKESQTFITTLSSIDKAIEDKKQEEEQQAHMLELEEIRKELPAKYWEFADVFSAMSSDTMPPERHVDHRLHLEQEPGEVLGYSPLYKMSSEELEAAREYILDNLNKGFIVPSQSPYASPILMARKPGGGLRFCVDYRKLNSITRKDRYPLPLIDEVMARISQAKVFTKLDIRQGFHRIRMHPDSEEYTTFRTRYGSYKYRVMPFGLTNGPATFQRLMNDIFMDMLDDFVTVFLDDILIFSESTAEHELHVKRVLQRLQEAGLQASLKKCEFSVTKTKFLGFIISTEGIATDPEKVAVVLSWERPTTVKGVQSFLGFCNFYRRFIHGYSRIARPLTQLTKKEVRFEWMKACTQAFEELKHRLASAPILAHYHPEWPTRVETDASDGAVAAVLSQKMPSNEQWHPVAYLSKTMAPAEINYPIHDKELLAIIVALTEWRAELEGLQRTDRFEILTDHQALTYFMTTKKLNSRQARWAEYLSRFHFMIQYRPGKSNTCADILTRREQDGEPSKEHRLQTLLPQDCLDNNIKEELHGMRQLQLAPLEQNTTTDEIHLIDQICQENRRVAVSEEFRSRVSDPENEWNIQEGLLTYKNRLFVPDVTNLRVKLLDNIHQQVSTAHPGQDKTKQLVKD